MVRTNEINRARKTVLVTLDPDPDTWHPESDLIDQAARLARRMNADLTLLHVGFDPALADAGREHGNGASQEMDSHRLRYLASQRVRQQQLANQIIDRYGLRVRISTRWDQDRNRAIERTAERWPTSVILKAPEPVAGRKTLSFQDAHLLRATPAPVWLVAGTHQESR